MAALSSNVLGWLSNVLSGTYSDSKRTFDDTVQVLSNYRTISPRTDVHTFPNGRSELLLLLSGTIPVAFRGAIYNFPLQIWVPQTYPREPPIIYVTPTESMIVRPGQHVDPSGQVYHPYLVGWAQFWDKSSILDLLTILRDVFAKEPPVAAKQPQAQQHPHQAQPIPPPLPQKPATQIQSPPPQQTPPQQTPPQQGPPPPPPKGDGYGPAQQHPQANPNPPQPDNAGPPVPPLPPKPGQAPSHYAPSPVQQQHRPGPPQQHYQPGPSQHYYSPGSAQQQHGPSPSPQQYASALPPHKYPSPQHQPYGSPTPGKYDQPAPLPPSLGAQSQPPISTPQGIPPQGLYQAPLGVPPGPAHGVIPPQQYASPRPLPGSTVSPPQQYAGPAQPHHSGLPSWNQPLPAQTQPKVKPPPPLDLMDDDITVTIPEKANISPPPIPPNPEKDMLLHQLADTLHRMRASALKNNESSLAGLSAQKRAMLNAQQILQAESQQLNQLSALLQSNANILRSALQQADQVIESSKSHPSPDIDELLVAPTVVANQLYNTVAEEKAIGDAIFVLGKAVERGRVAPTTFVKNTRSLAREWYLKKALAKKIARGMGLLGA